MVISSPSFLGIPYKVIALVTLVVQNSMLTILLHYSRINVEPSKMYSAASAVLLNELLKGLISFSIAFSNAVHNALPTYTSISSNGDGFLNEKRERGSNRIGGSGHGNGMMKEEWAQVWEIKRVLRGAAKMRRDVFSPDCWKLSIPACLYVIQNNLQFVAASNLSVPTFQVSYNLKILTTALFSVLLLKRKLSPKKWTGLFFLAVGVGIVQIQSISSSTGSSGSSSKQGGGEEMNQAKGLLAVASACMTSGLAGVYFEMVLKGSKTDLWIRNCQLSFFSMLPALAPVFLPPISMFTSSTSHATITTVISETSQGIFANFGFWAWAVVLTQVVGGLVTALVIKYSDNILKGFATSLAIVLSFLAGVVLFEFQVTTTFVVGTLIVIGSTYLFTSPDPEPFTRRTSFSSSSSPSSSSRAFGAPSPLFPNHQSHPSLDYSNSHHPPFSPTSAHFIDQSNSPPSALSALRSFNSSIGTNGGGGNFNAPTHRRAVTNSGGNLTPDFNTTSGFGIKQELELNRSGVVDHHTVHLVDLDYVGDEGSRRREDGF